MKAILLAAGFGSRLRPITDIIPKCLVPIKGKPLLEIWIEKLINIGINKILINTHYMHNQVEDFIEKSPYKNFTTLVHENILLGTAGTIMNNLNFINNEDILLIHADNFTLDNLENLIIAHNKRDDNCVMTMMAFRTNQPHNCGIIQINKKNILVDFHEKSIEIKGNLANAAVYILTPALTEMITNNKYTDFSTQVIPTLYGKINVYETKNNYIDIGTIENFLNAQYF
jgi:mannose-1-phosphate guanylyltransferase